MLKKYNVLTFADFPLPSYEQRAHRAVLFLDYSSGRIHSAQIVSPTPKGNFKNKEIEYITNYFDLSDFKDNQYRLLFRLRSIVIVFSRLIVDKLLGKFKNVNIIRVSNSYLTLLARLIRGKNNLIIADCCDFYFDLYREFGMPFAKIISPVLFLIEKFILCGVNILFVDTHTQKKFLIEKMGFPIEKCVVSPNGVLLDSFPFLREKDALISDEYGFLKNDIVLFYGGDISEMDGIELILRFVKENECINGKMLKVLIIGKGNNDYINTLRKYVNESSLDSRVIFDSFKPYAELCRYLSVADVCLSPFRITTTSNTVECGKIITYLLAGKRVLSTKADGVNGMYKNTINYFKDGDYVDFSEQLIHLIQKTEGTDDVMRRRRLGERFDFKKIIEHEFVVIDEYFSNPKQDFSRFDYKI